MGGAMDRIQIYLLEGHERAELGLRMFQRVPDPQAPKARSTGS